MGRHVVRVPGVHVPGRQLRSCAMCGGNQFLLPTLTARSAAARWRWRSPRRVNQCLLNSEARRPRRPRRLPPLTGQWPDRTSPARCKPTRHRGGRHLICLLGRSRPHGSYPKGAGRRLRAWVPATHPVTDAPDENTTSQQQSVCRTLILQPTPGRGSR